jgi:UMF1 family MFS transporter
MNGGRVPAPGRAGVAGWVLFDVATQPFFTLILTFVYAPYFASHLVGDEVRGQALWGAGVAAAGLAIALLSPVLGAIADRSGGLKRWVAASAALTVIGSSALYLGAPGAQTTVQLVLAAFALATIGAEFATTFTNALMPRLVPPDRLGRLSGAGWAAGYAGGLVALVLVLGLLVADPATGRTILGVAPPFGIDPGQREGERLSGPFSALWLLLFALPFFLFTPDAPRGAPIGAAVKAGLSDLAANIRAARARPMLWRYLLAHMLYVDGLGALFAFGAIYAAGVFGWSSTEIGVFGIAILVTGVAGSLIGGRLDDALGPKAVVAGSLVAMIAISLAIVSLGPNHVAFVVPLPGAPTGGLFDTPAELIYLGLGMALGVVAGPVQASSRTLLLKLAPSEGTAGAFGLLALSGKVTSFMAPALVAVVTAASGSQTVGMAVILIFFAAGLWLLRGVR